MKLRAKIRFERLLDLCNPTPSKRIGTPSKKVAFSVFS